VGGFGGEGRTRKESGKKSVVASAKTRIPKRRFVMKGATIWPTAVPRGSAA
jgi:hypothetical protein